MWASGWEERADEYLPHLLGPPWRSPFLRFERAVGRSHAHWKLDAIDAYAPERPLAWIDDVLDDACRDWALGRSRTAPTLLVNTAPPARPHRGRGRALERMGAGAAGRLLLLERRLDGQLELGQLLGEARSVSPAPIFSSDARSASNS